MSNFFTTMAVGKPSCNQCGLYKEAKSPKIPMMGTGKKGIFVLSGEPSYAEDAAGEPLAGNSGRLFASMLASNGVELDKDCYRMNALRCYSDSADSLKCVGHCVASIRKSVTDAKPKKILLLGTVAIASYYHAMGEVTKSLPANRGLSFWDASNNCWVFPLTSPGVYADTKDQCLIACAKRDLEQALAHTEEAPVVPKPEVRKLITVDAVESYLQWLLQEKPLFAFDYEATGLKPQLKGHKAVSVGICTHRGAVAFPLMHRHWDRADQKTVVKLWRKVLADRKIKKVVQAMNMESVWSKVMFGETNGIIWDTQLTSHIMDGREGGYYGLKFQSFLRWGVRDYSTALDSYIRAAPGSKFNRMEYAPVDALLQYNGLDALYTYHIYLAQQLELVGNEGLANKFFHRGLILCGEMHMNGMCMNVEYYKEQGKKLEAEIAEGTLEIETSGEAMQFAKQFKRRFEASKPDDVIDLFFKVLGFTSTKKTAKAGKEAVDVEVLNSIDHPLAKKILAVRKLTKLKSTYIDGYLREEAQGKIYSVFQLHRVISFRSSSAMPNYQNQPKRDKVAKKIARSGLIPSPGCVIAEADFSGAEVVMSACVVGSTLIETIEGKMTIADVAARCTTTPTYVYGYDLDLKRIKIARVTEGGLTRAKARVYKVTLDNGEHIVATKDHEFLSRYGKYVPVGALKPGMSLMPFYKKLTKNGYVSVNLNNRKSMGEHTLIGRDVLGLDVGLTYDSPVMHHRDEVRDNNALSNLEYMPRAVHTSLHHKGTRRGPLSAERRAHIGNVHRGVPAPQKGRPQTEEHKKALSLRMLGHIFTAEQKDTFSIKKKAYWKNKQNVTCLVCGKEFRSITNTHLLNSHNLSLAEYKAEFNHKVVSVEFHGYEDVYNINVDGIHNYAVGAGVVIKNCYHRDPNFIKYLVDSSTDMHRDCAKDLWLLKDLWSVMDAGTAKEIRQNTKGDWTFAEFYGSYWKQCAEAMWKKRSMKILPDGTTLEKHLRNMGVLGEKAFFNHVQAFEKKFWEEMFPAYAEWKKQVVRDYLRDGYVETFLGFRFKGYMNAREACNYPVQGTSFHLLLYVGYELMRAMQKLGMKTKLIGQIHDSLIADIPIEELAQYTALLNKIMGTLQDVFPWMVVPMKIEMECSYPREEGGSFAELEEINIDETIKVTDYCDVVFAKTKDAAGEYIKNSTRVTH
jgi:uracil-DNA glycosylase family 4